MAVIGCARISSCDQDPALQHDALGEAGAQRTFTDRASGATSTRPQLAAVQDYVREGDVLTVWRLDRFGRSLRDLIARVQLLEDRGVGFRSLTEAIDTSASGGWLSSCSARLRSSLLSSGSSSASAPGQGSTRRGPEGGRPRMMTPERMVLAHRLRDEEDQTLDSITATLGVGRSTLVRALSAEAEGHRRP